jgi:Na+-transporting methylmalonyl-CoA/oxaloacetate decarboxylase gamma subunit
MILSNISLGDASLVAGLGYAVVFFGLILLMLVVLLVGKCFTASEKRKPAPQPAPAEPVQAPAPKEAPGTAGELKLYNVDPKTAAMLMAITANKLQKPINELRFVSIKEVTE